MENIQKGIIPKHEYFIAGRTHCMCNEKIYLLEEIRRLKSGKVETRLNDFFCSGLYI